VGRSYRLYTIIAALLAASAARGQPGDGGSLQYPHQSLDKLASQADAVVIAALTQGVQSGSSISGVLEVRRSLKGSLAAGSVIPLSWQAPDPSSFGVAAPSQTWPRSEGIWLLKHAEGYAPMPLDHPAAEVPDYFILVSLAPLLPAYEPAVGATLMDRIVLEMASTLERGLQLGAGIPLTWLAQIYPSVAPETYDRLLASRNATLRAVALSVRLQLHDDSVLVKYEPALLELAASSAGIRLQAALELSRPPDPAALGVLGRIALSPEPGMQRCALGAARALAAIHSALTLPILGKMLDSRDTEIRTAAVNGLSSFVTNLPVRRPVDMASMAWMTPNGPGQYLTEDVKQHVELGPISKYRQEGIVDFWRAWWADKGASLTPAK